MEAVPHLELYFPFRNWSNAGTHVYPMPSDHTNCVKRCWLVGSNALAKFILAASVMALLKVPCMLISDIWGGMRPRCCTACNAHTMKPPCIYAVVTRVFISLVVGGRGQAQSAVV